MRLPTLIVTSGWFHARPPRPRDDGPRLGYGTDLDPRSLYEPGESEEDVASGIVWLRIKEADNFISVPSGLVLDVWNVHALAYNTFGSRKEDVELYTSKCFS
ncbi:3159_t:CDS:1 [Paraglomus occultum]|uniref:3159_t:CDS:1 n=1 Tax=Paraglomus occultum TaxID=144539 RepID=A0A9N9CVV1_9GLOM|nr:3159_t:CDS:1 [Paraglomus occultum]